MKTREPAYVTLKVRLCYDAVFSKLAYMNELRFEANVNTIFTAYQTYTMQYSKTALVCGGGTRQFVITVTV